MKHFSQDRLDDWGRTEVCYRQATRRVYWLTYWCFALAAIVFLALLLAGCQSSPTPKPIGPLAVPSILLPPATTPIARTVKATAVPPVLTVTLVWTPNYLPKYPTEQTAIEACPNLALPSWTTVFTGQTNACVVSVDAPQEFFRAYNFVP